MPFQRRYGRKQLLCGLGPQPLTCPASNAASSESSRQPCSPLASHATCRCLDGGCCDSDPAGAASPGVAGSPCGVRPLVSACCCCCCCWGGAGGPWPSSSVCSRATPRARPSSWPQYCRDCWFWNRTRLHARASRALNTPPSPSKQAQTDAKRPEGEVVESAPWPHNLARLIRTRGTAAG